MRFIALAVITAAVALSPFAVRADPISVTETVSGSAGDWTLDFTVNNNLTQGQVYFFGVQTDSTNIAGTGNFTQDASAGTSGVWSYLGNGVVYNDLWMSPIVNGQPVAGDDIGVGGSLSGFDVYSTDILAPTDVAWFAYAVGNMPNLAGCTAGCGSNNSGFTGTIAMSDPTDVPEPATLPRFGVGALGLALAVGRRRGVAGLSAS